MFFSQVAISSLLVRSVAFSCGTKQTGALARISFNAGYGSAQKASGSMLNSGAFMRASLEQAAGLASLIRFPEYQCKAHRDAKVGRLYIPPGVGYVMRIFLTLSAPMTAFLCEGVIFLSLARRMLRRWKESSHLHMGFSHFFKRLAVKGSTFCQILSGIFI